MKWITRLTLVVCLSVAAFAQPALPRAAEDFRITDPSGKTLTVSECRGKVVVMQFLYTTCSHCQETARMLSTLEKEFGPRGLQVIGVAFNPEAQRPGVIGDFMKTNDVAFPVGAATPDAALAFLQAAGNGAIRGAADRRDRPAWHGSGTNPGPGHGRASRRDLSAVAARWIAEEGYR